VPEPTVIICIRQAIFLACLGIFSALLSVWRNLKLEKLISSETAHTSAEMDSEMDLRNALQLRALQDASTSGTKT
jgi:hypothetical protein